ncbi:MAG: M28 family peptidase [Gemmatimonadetes bacterium]|nr:M28 family peptidase [Gemmatimonadota bacterium]
MPRFALLLTLLFAPVLSAQQPPPPAIDSIALWNDFTALSADSMEGRRTGTRGGASARAYLVRRLTAAGVEPLVPGYVQHFDAGGRDTSSRDGVNVLGVVRGADTSRVIVISAHFDHLGVRNGQVYNGADDNASGTAAVLALAAAYAAQPPKHSMIFAFFDGEEAGMHGSRAFVERPPIPRRRIVANVNLDMVARLDKNELCAAGATPYPFFRPLLRATAAAAPVKLRMGHDLSTPDGLDNWTSLSDHASFHAVGIPFVYFGVEDHPDYHRVTDDAERVDAGRYLAAVRTIGDFLRRLDGDLEKVVPGRRQP